MRAFWTTTRPNGDPIQPGTFCYVTDLEDGTNPIYTYGATQEEVTNKLAAQNANAQIALAQRKAPRSAPIAEPVAPRVFSADDVMRATVDLENPAKAGDAISTLVQASTGVDLRRVAVTQFGQIAEAWEAGNHDFNPHPGNKRLLTSEAMRLAGGQLGQVTSAHLDKAFATLTAQGLLLETAAPAQPINPQPSTEPFPVESQVQRVEERPRGVQFSTGYRSSGTRPAPPTRRLAYTEEQIRNMPASKSRELIESNDPAYAAACDFYFGQTA